MALHKINSSQLSGRLNDFVREHENGADIAHAIFGLNSEAGELVEALCVSMLDQESLDKVNIVEECGDVLWYLALLLRSVGSTLDEAMEANINKLAKRYPEQFTTDAAINRDVDAEREGLEQDIQAAE